MVVVPWQMKVLSVNSPQFSYCCGADFEKNRLLTRIGLIHILGYKYFPKQYGNMLAGIRLEYRTG
jgi:hypothetical protein